MKIIFVFFLFLSLFAFIASSFAQEEYRGTQKFLKGVGSEYDENGIGFDIEYVLEGQLHNFILVDNELNSVTFEYDSKGIEEDVLIIFLPKQLIDEPIGVYVNGDEEPNSIRNIIGNITQMIIPLYQDSKTITIEGRNVIGKHNIQEDFILEIDSTKEQIEMKIDYELNGEISNIIKVNTFENSLALEYNSNGISEDTLLIYFPKNVIEDPLAVYINGEQEPDAVRGNYGNITKMTIPLTKDSKEITIMGTRVIPEFGTVSALVLIVSITIIIGITSRKIPFQIKLD